MGLNAYQKRWVGNPVDWMTDEEYFDYVDLRKSGIDYDTANERIRDSRKRRLGEAMEVLGSFEPYRRRGTGSRS